MYANVKDMLPYVNKVKFAMQNLRHGEPTTPAEIEELVFFGSANQKNNKCYLRLKA